MTKRRLLTLILFGLALMTRVAAAESSMDRQVLNTPVYDPGSKKYYLLKLVPEEGNYKSMWNYVEDLAKKDVYKGVHGRLAIVDSLEVHEFLLTTFKPNPYDNIWIGLRYLCKPRQLEWTDGKLWKPGSFQIWDKVWNQDPNTCTDKDNPNDWAPVAYTPSMKSWIVKGSHKGYPLYFEEFPTGGP